MKTQCPVKADRGNMASKYLENGPYHIFNISIEKLANTHKGKNYITFLGKCLFFIVARHVIPQPIMS